LSYKYIFFDLDDTLLNHKAAEQAGLQDIHREFELFSETNLQNLVDEYHEVNSEQWGFYSRGEVTREQLQRNRFEQTLHNLGLDGSRYQEVGDLYMPCYRNHWQWMDGAQRAYKAILEKYPVGILTNGFSETQQLKFEQFGLYDSADHTVISEDVGVLKPDPKVFAHATQKTGVAKDEILYVGDSFRSDIVGGSQFGWNTAWFTTNGNEDQHQKADFVFSDFNALINYLEI
jgi:putative hydrolase of the HAD superfamily